METQQTTRSVISMCPEDSSAEKHQTLRESLPQEEMPREKLRRFGRDSLTNEELIAIFLRTGVRGCNVMELAHSMLERVDFSLGKLVDMEVSEICQLVKGIGLAKACTLAAVLELGKRAARASLKRPELSRPDLVYEYMIEILRSEKQEHVFALNLNHRNELIKTTDVGIGTSTRVVIHPRDVFRDAINYGASRIVLVHNHPSGSPEPSSYDEELTAGIAKAGEALRIPLVDHIIIGYGGEEVGSNYYSFRLKGKL